MSLSIFQRVAKFNQDAGTQLNQEMLSMDDHANEVNMLQEELNELDEALINKDRVEIADALADIIYVAMGTMAKLGIDYERVMNEVCTSNETKYTHDDEKGFILVKNEAGKIQKSPNFRKPDLSFVSQVSNIGILPNRTSQEAFKTGFTSINERKPILSSTIKLRDDAVALKKD